MVEYTTFRYIRPYHGWIYHIPVHSILPWSNTPHSGIFDLTMVEYITFRYIRLWLIFLARWNNIPFSVIFDLIKVEYTTFQYIRPWLIFSYHDWIYTIFRYIGAWLTFSYQSRIINHIPVCSTMTDFYFTRVEYFTVVEYTTFRHDLPWLIISIMRVNHKVEYAGIWYIIRSNIPECVKFDTFFYRK